MDGFTTKQQTHIAAVPYPGRGHVNAMMNFCKLLSLRDPSIVISFVVTEEWLSFLAGEPQPPTNIHFATIPNVIPSEHGRANDFPAFLHSVDTDMEAPTEALLAALHPPPTALLADAFLPWAPKLGSRLSLPVASLWPMSATVFSILYHIRLLQHKGHFPADLSERGDEIVDYIPGVSKTCLADLPSFFSGNGLEIVRFPLNSAHSVENSQFLIFTSVYELESSVIDALKPKFPFPIYTIGPSAPYFDLQTSVRNDPKKYFQWLDSQAEGSVLYVSQGSFLSVSSAQMDEIVAGVKDSGVRFLWVARGDDGRLKDVSKETGVVVSWCDQLRVLCHSAVGGFWTHGGWNSTLEGVYAGVPMLVWPILWDQIPNGKKIAEDWKVGVRYEVGSGRNLVSRGEIAEVVKRFMNAESEEGREMRRRVAEYREICRRAVAKGGSSSSNIESFLSHISVGLFQ